MNKSSDSLQKEWCFWVHVSWGAKKTAFAGYHHDAVKIRVAARPIEGKANAELIAFLAGVFGVSIGAVEILQGKNSKRKRVRVVGHSGPFPFLKGTVE